MQQNRKSDKTFQINRVPVVDPGQESQGGHDPQLQLCTFRIPPFLITRSATEFVTLRFDHFFFFNETLLSCNTDLDFFLIRIVTTPFSYEASGFRNWQLNKMISCAVTVQITLIIDAFQYVKLPYWSMIKNGKYRSGWLFQFFLVAIPSFVLIYVSNRKRMNVHLSHTGILSH